MRFDSLANTNQYFSASCLPDPWVGKGDQMEQILKLKAAGSSVEQLLRADRGVFMGSTLSQRAKPAIRAELRGRNKVWENVSPDPDPNPLPSATCCASTTSAKTALRCNESRCHHNL